MPVNLKISRIASPSDYRSLRGIRQNMKVIFSCLTAIPFVVFAFIYFRIGAFNTALSASLIILALILVLDGFIVFRRMAEHIEQLSSAIIRAEGGALEKVQKTGDTKELAMIADAFNRTLSKLENTAKELGVKAVQTSTLNEVRDVVSKTINMEEIARFILERAVNAVASQAGYMAVRRGKSQDLHIAAISGVDGNIKEGLRIDDDKALAFRVVEEKIPILIEDIEQEDEMKRLNVPDMKLARLLFLPILAKRSVIGALVLGRDRDQSPYKEEEVQFLQTLLQQVAFNFENAMLYEGIQQSNRELKIALDSQKKAQDHLLTSARMSAFGELSIKFAHELNNPLTGILGYSELLLASGIDDKVRMEHIEEIRRQAIRAGRITRSILDFSANKRVYGERADLNAILQKALLPAEARIRDAGIRLDLQLSKELPYVEVDQTLMEQIFFHLISNAMNAVTGVYKLPVGIKEGGSGIGAGQPIIAIETGMRGDNIYISFKDNGPGISPADIPRIFDPFFSTQEKVSQVGLGLWICHMMITAYGGRISVESEIGKGSLFTVELPVTERLKIEY
jgi:signal transduction histidine kinase